MIQKNLTSLKHKKKKQKRNKKKLYDTSSELYSDLLETYFDKYDDLSNVKRSKINHKYDSANLTLGEYDYSQWYKEKNQMTYHYQKVMKKS